MIMLGYVVALWAVAILGGYVPFAVGSVGEGKQDQSSAWVSVLNVLSGGVFVAAGFMHLLPQAQEGLMELSEKYHFEFALFFASLGFILVFLLEEAIQQLSCSNPHPYSPSILRHTHYHQYHQQHQQHVPSPINSAMTQEDEARALMPPPPPPPTGQAPRAPPSVLPGGGAGAVAGGVAPSYLKSLAGATPGPTPGGKNFFHHGIGYGISADSVDGRSVDENYHIYGSSADSVSALPSPVFWERKKLGGGVVDAAADKLPALLPPPETIAVQGGAVGARGGTSTASASTREEAPAGLVYPGGVSGGNGGGGGGGAIRVAAPPFSREEANMESTWAGLGAADGVHVTTSLRGDGPRGGEGIRRTGPKGTYGALSNSPTRPSGSGSRTGFGKDRRKGLQGSWTDPERGFLNADFRRSLASSQNAMSPARDGLGPWIGRRVAPAQEPLEPEGEEQSSQLSGSVARVFNSSLRLHCHDATSDSFVTNGNSTSMAYSANVGLILGAVLSFHAVMEGLGLGASSASAAPGIFVAIVVHKGLAAFSLGCIFFSSDATRLQYFLFMGVFALLTPLGAAAGMLVRASVDDSSGAGVCTALGAGTFLHVAAMEVLPRDLLHDDRMKTTKMACLVVGYLAFAALSLYV